MKNRNPERLAWAILLASFFVCVSLPILGFLGVRSYILFASDRQRVVLQVPRGPLRVRMGGVGEAIAIAETREEIPERSVIITDATAGRLVFYTPDENGFIVGTIQIYDNTEVALLYARSPRFQAGRSHHTIRIEVRTGLVRLNVIHGEDGKDTQVEVRTHHGTALLQEGVYEVRVNETTTQVTAIKGRGSVSAAAESAALGPAGQAVLSEQGIALSAAPTNLVTNGDFELPLEHGWISETQQEEAPAGSVAIVADEGRNVADFYRMGADHAEVSILQNINCDTREFAFLELRLAVRIEEHDVPVCGMYGSECPLMVRIEYIDANGNNQEWVQGFYQTTDPNTPGNPSVCVTCSTRNEHIRVPKGIWYSYRSQNLIPLLSQDNRPPQRIETLTIYASGHSFHAQVAEVELVGE